MKMKTAELTGAALDWAVAMAEGWQRITAQDNGGEHPWLAKHGKYQDPKHYRPTSNWMQGGPIIERECIDLEWTGIPNADFFCTIQGKYEAHGNTPLIAAMRCYVASKLGDEIELPGVLL
jgi:hypothetical protein